MKKMTLTTTEVIWQARLRGVEVEFMEEQERKEFISELERAIQDVCWKYGVHN